MRGWGLDRKEVPDFLVDTLATALSESVALQI